MQKTIYLPDDGTWARIVAAADAVGESASEYIRRATAERIARERKRAAKPAA